MADRVTTKQIMTALEVLHSLTGLEYSYDVIMNWHTVYCENSRMFTMHSKKDTLNAIYAMQQHIYTLDRKHMLTKKGN